MSEWWIGPYEGRKEAATVIEGTPLRMRSEDSFDDSPTRTGQVIGWVLTGVIVLVVLAFATAPVWWALRTVWGWAL